MIIGRGGSMSTMVEVGECEEIRADSLHSKQARLDYIRLGLVRFD